MTLCLSFPFLVLWVTGRDIDPFYMTSFLFPLQGVILTFCELTQSQSKEMHAGTFFSSPQSKMLPVIFFYHSPPAFVHWTARAAAGLGKVLLLVSLELFNRRAFNAQMRSVLSRAELQTDISFLFIRIRFTLWSPLFIHRNKCKV